MSPSPAEGERAAQPADRGEREEQHAEEAQRVEADQQLGWDRHQRRAEALRAEPQSRGGQQRRRKQRADQRDRLLGE